MKTINERIVSVAREVDQLCQSLGLAYPNELEDILAKHFMNPWLDAPDGPGWWWLHAPPAQKPKAMLVTEYRGILSSEGGIPVSFWDDSKWQRVIGPSE